MLYAVGICIAYVVGILWGLYLKQIALGVVFFCLLLCLSFFFQKAKKNSKRFRWIGNNTQILKENRGERNIYFFLAIGFLFGMIYSIEREKDFKTCYEEGTCQMKGEIAQKLEEGNYYHKYRFYNEDAKNLLLYCPKEFELEENTLVFLEGNFEKPSIQRNRGGFHYANYLYSQNIYGSIYVKDISKIEILESNRFHFISYIRKNIFEVLGKIFPKNQLGILLGMLIGDTSYILEETKIDFQKSGITHLLAVSGSNVAYVVMMTKFLFQKLVGKNFSNWLTILMIFLFVFISGASPSVVRAGLMAIILILSEIFARPPNTYATIAVSALIILLYNPFVLCDIGFLLSFGGTLGIIFFNDKISEIMKEKFSILMRFRFFSIIVDILSVTLSAQIFLLPVMWYYFNQISFVSILTNLLVGSFTGAITVMGVAMYFLGIIYFPIAKLLGYSIYFLISMILKIASFCSEIPYGNITLPTIRITEIILYYSILYCIFTRNKRKEYKVCKKMIISVLIILSFFLRFPLKKHIEIHMIDVGQGDSILLQTKRGKNILIDGGGSENGDYDVGEKVLVPYLLDNTNGVIDYMIISHFHEDHMEGCISVLETLKVKRIIIGTQPKKTNLYQTVLEIASDKKIPIISLVAGDTFQVEDIKFEVLFPKKEIEIRDDLNNNSIVLKMIYREITMLFTGDIEIEAEEKIVESQKDIDVDILKVAHHGSQTSSLPFFLEKVTPKVALISVGENNKFGHPNNEVLERICNLRWSSI